MTELSTSNCLLSVIVPVYNSEKYLAGSIQSLLKESTRNFEVILVDDGSTDDSGRICDEIASADNRVRVIHKDNGGMCQSRNLAIMEARGKWIAFMDNDDLVLSGFVDDNLKLILKYDCDCLLFGRQWVQSDAGGNVRFSNELKPSYEICLHGKEIMQRYFEILALSDGVWVRFFKRSFLLDNKIEFNESFRNGFEDTLFTDMVIANANTYAFNPRTYYCWMRRTSHSSSMQVNKNRVDSLRTTIEYEYQTMVEHDLIDSQTNECGRVIFSRIFDVITTGHLSGNCCYSRQLATYRAVRDATSFSFDLLHRSRLKLSYEIPKMLFISGQYRALYAYLQLGGAVKMAIARIGR